ncbi:MGDG synthase family glycosyltransferase [Zongyangia hominis]|uniref:Glycosyl transferase n=1 Tax=Zongyangia hominis TaxID=2763677 RepID=A0A926IBD1_9FIRM|nr:glycosyltransferase [Zongyangia hominis]MBC8571111.1 glycosyl transferase [Zongyangia hominis]
MCYTVFSISYFETNVKEAFPIKALVLSCNTGEGHNAAARAVYEKLKSRHVHCEFVDALSLAGERTSKVVSSCYVGSTRLPGIFRFLYAAGTAISNNRHKSPVYFMNRLYRQEIDTYLSQHQFDVVITSHLFAAEVLTSLKAEGRLRVKTVAIATDYTCIPFWEETQLDRYILPHRDLLDEFEKKGLPKEKLIPLGIPVRDCFSQHVERSFARHTLHLRQEGPIYLLMSGSMGFGKLGELTAAILRRHGERVTVVILCGNNDSLIDRLKNQFASCPHVRVQPFTPQVSLYMDAADVLFSKPGGLTSTEAAVKQIPLIHTSPIPGCETKNARFFSERGMSFYDESIERQLDFAQLVTTDPDVRRRMQQAQRAHTNVHAAGQICDLAAALIE